MRFYFGFTAFTGPNLQDMRFYCVQKDMRFYCVTLTCRTYSWNSNMLQRIVYMSLFIAVFYGLTEVKARRCSEMLRDQPCVVEGSVPLKLRCDHKAGKFFQIKSISVEYRPGVWTEVIEAQALANTDCRNSRRLDIINLQYYCTVNEKSLCPYADRMRNVKIEYFCWELDPELLTGFSTTDQSGWFK
ncbi:hypothetical protein OS493_008558 [Desmophyllum pertusum]|uniref:Uncharacterized protein n=1 Tax=Desmophyllum pertusum TaxID=174260 RepID=A0A9X0D4C7_9CNID|nr:hypothetical protein OS493_008558 [Desmophyllum pertusum]